MIIYLVKSTILLALLLGAYKLFLENEKMHTFNRFFLLAALVLGFTAPLVQIDINPTTKIAGLELAKMESTVNAPSEFVARTIEPVITNSQSAPVLEPDKAATESTGIVVSEGPMFTRKEIIAGIYLLITLFFLIRFGSGLYELFSKVRKGTKSSFKTSTLVLLDEAITPQSFFKWIFLNKKDFESGNIASEILEHELTHIREKHSLDVLLIEFLKTIFWFNPVLYFYKHAIQLNHEFLADQSVLLKDGANAKSYQKILINACSAGQENVTIASKFNQQKIKRRAYMIKKSKSTRSEVFKVSIILPVVITLCIVFSANADSQTSDMLSDVSESATTSRVYVQYYAQVSNSGMQSEKLPDSPFVSDFEERLKTYTAVFHDYESGTKNKRDVLYQRARLVWLHQRLTPTEQKARLVPNLPEDFLTDIVLTEEEHFFQQKLSSYKNLLLSYSEIPTDKDDKLYSDYEDLKLDYESLPLSSRLFIVNNMPPDIQFFYLEKDYEEKFGKDISNPFQMSLSGENKHLDIHYLDINGNAVSKMLSELTVDEKEYLKNNARKSFVTQVYPLPIEENPSQKDFEEWQDDYLYKITLDGEEIKNEELKTLDPESIHHVNIFEVRWNGNRRVPYDYEIQLRTYSKFHEMVKKYRPSQGIIPFHSAIIVD